MSILCFGRLNIIVTFGDSDFRKWAEEGGLNDSDIALIKKTSRRNAITFFLLYLLGGVFAYCAELMRNSSGDAINTVGAILYFLSAVLLFTSYITYPMFLEAWAFSKFMKGSFNTKPGFLWTLFFIPMFFLWFSIIPFIIWQLSKRRLWGTGFKKLLKKGLIGNH